VLGFIVAPLGQEVPGQYPNEINYTHGPGEYLCPFDPQWNQRGEQGMYYDTPLGGPAIPTDAELATVYGYTPVMAAWVKAKEGYFPGPWRTPGGWNPAGKWGPPMSLSGVGQVADVTLPSGTTTPEAQAIVNALNAQNARIFKVTVISTAIVAVAALINSYRIVRQLRREETLLRKTLKTV
jgi:hypothetical protein